MVNKIRKRISRGYSSFLDKLGYKKHVNLLGKCEVAVSSYSRNILQDCERAAGEVFISWLHDGGNTLDIGANYGRYTFIAASFAKPGNRVVSIEADPYQYYILKRNLRLNGFGSIVNAYNRAAWDEDSSIPFYVSAGGRSSAASEWGSNPKVVEVAATPVDKICNSIGFVPDVVKIDIEGAEYRCLVGMSSILEKAHPKLLLELHPSAIKSIGGSLADLEKLLKDYGYGLYDLDNQPIESIQEYTEDHKMVIAI